MAEINTSSEITLVMKMSNEEAFGILEFLQSAEFCGRHTYNATISELRKSIADLVRKSIN